jgi:hypothetical protein
MQSSSSLRSSEDSPATIDNWPAKLDSASGERPGAVRAVGLSGLALRGSIDRQNVEVQRKEDRTRAEVEIGEQCSPFALGILIVPPVIQTCAML